MTKQRQTPGEQGNVKRSRKFYEKHHRPKEHVILGDLRWILGSKRNGAIVTGNRTAVKDALNRAQDLLYPGGEYRGLIPPREHAHMADSICAGAIALLTGGSKVRTDGFLTMIRASECSSRTNYQFVRQFLWRNLGPMMVAKGLDLRDFPEMFPKEIVDQLCEDRASREGAPGCGEAESPSEKAQSTPPACTDIEKPGLLRRAGNKLDSWTVSGALKIEEVLAEIPVLQHVQQIATTAAGTALGMYVYYAWLSKGEFTHFDEVRRSLVALQKAAETPTVAIIVSDEDRANYVANEIHPRAGSDNKQERTRAILVSQWRSQVFRYYVFPQEYILMLAGEKGQFLIFQGLTTDAVEPIRELLRNDWDMAATEGHIFVAE